MKLKNIHNRKDFIKIDEFFGGTSGGAGDKDGFANNAKLKDTYLGKLIDGIFGGISKLWKKSKEYFAINRLIAQLINELFRGIILFCFSNNISLDGKWEDSDVDKGINGADIDENTGDLIDSNGEDEDEDEGEEVIHDPMGDLEADFEEELEIDDDPTYDDIDVEGDNIQEEEEDYSKFTKAELIEKIKRITEGINEDSKRIRDKKGQVKFDSNQLNVRSYTIAEKNEKVKKINKLKKDVIFLSKELEKSKKQLIKLKEALEKFNNSGDTSFDVLRVACEKKYSFNPKSEYLPTEPPDFVDIGSMSVKDFTNNLSTIKYHSEYIKIDQEFTVVDDNGKLLHIKVWNVDNSTNEVFFYDDGKLKKIKDVKLLPKYFPKLKEPKKKCYDFLDKYITLYETMGDDRKEKMETIYMQYKVIDEISKVRRVSMIQETIDYADVILESLVKIKPDNPKAGNTNVGRKIAMSAGVSSANVGDILTKKDKEKFKDKIDLFKISIKNINLAEIENTIEKIEKTDPDIKTKVASYVNPYNLKSIQISAQQLMDKGDEKDNSLKMKWDKELADTFASFNDIMNVESIDITKDNFGGKVPNNDKVTKDSSKMTNEINIQINNAKIMEKLPIDRYNSLTYSNMKNGDFSYYAFTYPNLEKVYNTSLSPVSSVFKDFGLLCVTSCFSDFNENKVVEDDSFKNMFISPKSDEATTSSDKVNVYLLFKYDQRFPSRNKPRPTKMFVLNEYIINSKSYLSIKKVANGSKNVAINKNSITNLNKKEFIFNINSISIHKFISSELNSVASEFNIVRSKDPSINTDFRVISTQPAFLVDDMSEYLKKLSEMLK